jgi:hypothetical protein
MKRAQTREEIELVRQFQLLGKQQTSDGGDWLPQHKFTSIIALTTACWALFAATLYLILQALS